MLILSKVADDFLEYATAQIVNFGWDFARFLRYEGTPNLPALAMYQLVNRFEEGGFIGD